MKKLLKIFFAILLVIIATYFIAVRVEKHNYRIAGSKFIEKIEKYKEEYGKLPQNIEDTGLVKNMEIGPYYEKIDKDYYIVYFCLGFDEFYFYDSKTKSWQKDVNIPYSK